MDCFRGPVMRERCSSFVACAAVLLLASPSLAANDVAGSLITFNDNGAWSWFEDERAIVDTTAGKIVLSSVADDKGTNGATRNGDVDVVSYDLASGSLQSFTLKAALEADDHDSAALLQLPDGRYLASYSKHSTDRLVRWRVSSAEGSVGAWGAEDTFSVNPNTMSGGTTYSNLYHLSESNDIFNFHREAGTEGGFDPHYLKWNLGSETEFSYGGRLLTGPEGNVGNNDRPYLRYTSNGVDRIDFIATDAHPRNLVSNSVYHGYIEHEGSGNYGIFKSDGTRLGDLSETNTSPYKASDFTPLMVGNTVSPANGLLMTRGWTTDVELDATGHPYAVFTARVNDSSSDHRFFYARHTASGWGIHELAKAGGFLYSGENDYTGLVSLDPSNPDRLFMSTKIDPRDQSNLSRYEIFEGNTTNAGTSWTWSPITANSSVDNLRPIVPKWDANHTALLWMRGTYTSYTDYNLDVVGLTNIVPIQPPPPPVGEVIDVTGPWTNAVGFGSGPITNANTSSPTVGDGTSNSATQEMIDSPFEAVTLANNGDKIVFTGSVTLSGTVNSPASSGNPRTQFRFGLFDGDEFGTYDEGWVGYYMSNRHGDSSGSAGTLARKPVGNDSAYLSTEDQNSLATMAGDGTSASLFHDDTYAMNLAIERSGSDLIISGSLNGSNGFTQFLSATDTTASTLGTYTFDHLGFLLGMNLGTDLATFSNLQVTFFPAGVAGDYNGNNSVDAADFVLWRSSLGPGSLANENGVSPGMIDGPDYNFWRSRFGATSGAGSGSSLGDSATIPEPNTPWRLLPVATLWVVGRARAPRTSVN